MQGVVAILVQKLISPDSLRNVGGLDADDDVPESEALEKLRLSEGVASHGFAQGQLAGQNFVLDVLS